MEENEKFVMGKTTFVDDDEAIRMSNDLNTDFTPERICPLIRGKCTMECVCFIPAFPYKNTNDEDGGKAIRIGGLKCGNAMFHGNKPMT